MCIKYYFLGTALQRGTEDSVTAILLIYCLNCYQSSWSNCYFCYITFHILSILYACARFCVSGEAWETSFSIKKRQAEGHEERGLSWKVL